MRDPRDRRPTPEQRLALRLCAAFHEGQAEIATLLDEVEPDMLLALLERLNLVTLLGMRLRAVRPGLWPRFDERLSAALDRAAAEGRLHELVLLSVSAELTHAGVLSLPLKGSALARAVHGDPALRVSGDIDLLVDPSELPRAVEVVEQMGWRREASVSAGLPPLHVRLFHDELPPLELHWRVHWYEARFSADALGRARLSAPGEPMRMRPADELATLVLFYVRDGLSGLRLVADVTGWCRTRKLMGGLQGELFEICQTYPELGPPLAAGVSHLAALVGLPVASPAPVRRRELAARRLANPFLAGEPTQIRADASFVDILLSPPGGRWAAAGRQFDNAPSIRGVRGSRRELGRWSHTAKTVARWCASGARATAAPRRASVGALRESGG